MRSGGGKQKGSAFEREVCKALSNWLSEGARSDLFWRSAMSGGRAKVLSKSGIRADAQSGDISSVDRLSARFIERYSVEAKFYKDLNLQGIFYGTTSGLLDFWEQCAGDAANSNKTPMLIAKQNFKPSLMFLPRTELHELGLHRNVLAVVPRLGMGAVLFDTFMELVDPKIFEVV